MAVENVSFLFASRARSRDWTSQELAEFYRVESALIQGGMRIITDRGLSDEGDPWFIFCRGDDGEPVVHFARIDGQYIIASPAYEGVARGLDFRSMVQDLISRHKLAPVNRPEKSNIFMHPAALLIVLVGTAFFKSPGQAQADEIHKVAGSKDPASKSASDGFTHNLVSIGLNSGQSAAYDQAEIVQNMNQLLAAVAASAIFIDGGEQFAADNTSSNSPPPLHASVYGNEETAAAAKHALIDQLYANPFDAGANNFAASTSTPAQPAAASSKGFGDVVSSVDSVMTEFNQIHHANLDNTGPQALVIAKDIGGAWSMAYSYEAGLLAQKSAATILTTQGAVVVPQLPAAAPVFAGALQSDFLSDPNSSSTNGVYYENGTIVSQLPTSFQGVASLASVTAQSGSAENYLVGNNIYINLHLASAASSNPSNVTPPSSANTDSATHSSSNIDATTPNNSGSASSFGSANVYSATSTETITSFVFTKTLDLFLQDTPDVGIYVSHDHFVLYNAALGQTAAAMESINMAFNDGSSIAIVGQAQVLNNILHQAQ
jgi:hypothetical protein